MGRAVGAWSCGVFGVMVSVRGVWLCGHPDLQVPEIGGTQIVAALGESQYGDFSTALRFRRNDRSWVVWRRAVASRYPTLSQKRERVGHPELGTPREDVAVWTP